ncbi:MAG: RagB/SusD family nutrient uptake outer membrane protein [Cyclobacteriaceae bacterium]
MKKIIYSLFAFALLASSCEDMEFIEPDPQDRITIEIALGDLDGVNAVLNSAYNRLINQNYYGQQMMITPDVLADNLVVGVNTGRYIGEQVNQVRAHISLWDDPANPSGAGYSVRSSYNAYRTINDCNIILQTLPDVASEDEARAGFIEGQARFIRALSYHDLLRVYSYEPGQEVGGWNSGVVIRTEAVLGSSGADLRTRSTNVEGYDLVKADLTAAIPLLPIAADITQAPNRVSKEAAQALLARVYLYEGSYAQAAAQAQAALSTTTASLIDGTVDTDGNGTDDYYDSWEETVHPESIFELAISLVDWNSVDGVNASLCSITNTDAGYAGAIGAVRASAEFLAAFEAGDVRSNLWVETAPDFTECRKWRGELGDYRENIPIIRYSEVLLIQAEAKARTGDDAGALVDLNLLRESRGLAAITSSGSALIDAILAERRLELVTEGHRFFDMKRLGMDIAKPASNGGGTFQYNDFRVIAPLNADYLSINDLIADNPNY